VSIEISCQIEGVNEFKQAIQCFDHAMQRRVQQQLANWAEEAKNLARQLVPVRTGHLRSTIYAKVREWVAEVGAEATYACWVEFGTRYMRARPYLYPAIQKHLPMLEQIICDALNAARAEAGL